MNALFQKIATILYVKINENISFTINIPKHSKYFWVLFGAAFICSFQVTVHAQISGKVVDMQDVPLPYATVLLLNPTDSSLIKGTVTDERGNYALNHTEIGTYVLGMSMIGYEDAYSVLFHLPNNGTAYNVSTIKLQTTTSLLKEVEVVEKRALFEQQIDRLVVNVENSITLSGVSALDVLKQSPGVAVNQQSNSLSMSGKEGVVVMINGKVIRMPPGAVVQMLGGMNADNVKKIELIHTPPANFDAQGNAGFINIVLKKNQDEGINGGLSVNAGYGRKEKAGGSINLNFRKNKINIFGDYSWKYNHSTDELNTYRAFEKEGVLYENNSEVNRDPTKTHVQNARLGIDFHLTDNTIVGVLTSWAARHWTMKGIAHTSSFTNGQLTNRSQFPSDELNRDRTNVTNINLSHKITEKQQINIDIDYATFFNNNPSNYLNQNFDSNDNLLSETQSRVAKKTPLDIWVGKIDYTNNFSDNITLSLGLKGTTTSFDNDVLVEELHQGIWETAPIFSSEATMSEKVGAAYSALSWKMDESLELKVGLRYEFADINLSTVSGPNLINRTNGRLFPSLFISKAIDKDHKVQFAYSRRINRPSFKQLAPFFFFIDPTTVITGNSTLVPAIADAVKGTYIWKTLQMNVQYTYTDNLIGRFQPTIDVVNNTQLYGSRNFSDGHQAAISFSLPWTITDWWELRTNWTGQWTKINDEIESRSISFTNRSWYMNGSSILTLPEKYSIEVSGNYFSSTLFGSVLRKPFYTINIGFQKELKDNKGILKFSVNDIFESSNWRWTLDNPNIDFTNTGAVGFAESVFRLTYSKRFGNNKLKGERKRAMGSAEEQQRVK